MGALQSGEQQSGAVRAQAHRQGAESSSQGVGVMSSSQGVVSSSQGGGGEQQSGAGHTLVATKGTSSRLVQEVKI
jgi:hypothetical protein